MRAGTVSAHAGFRLKFATLLMNGSDCRAGARRPPSRGGRHNRDGTPASGGPTVGVP